MALSADEREAFLAEPHVAVLAVDAGAARGPVAAPVWYGYTPGGDLVIYTGRQSRKARLIEAAGRCTLTVQRVQPTYRYVAVEGRVSFHEARPESFAAIAERYLPVASVPTYVTDMFAQPAPMVEMRLTPERWNAADLGAV
ncbi:pyridoxamine 5'-phosphate oxidase family protein [Streptomyces sp. NPDC059740]|uniref:pyridoxamine 5'-phosphate oxidase family protein n=1 Tax=Streptomyces sp. NPDC059740 TaxID=3346926 RepID=UPI00365FEC00